MTKVRGTCRGCAVPLTRENARVVAQTSGGLPCYAGACRTCENAASKVRAQKLRDARRAKR